MRKQLLSKDGECVSKAFPFCSGLGVKSQGITVQETKVCQTSSPPRGTIHSAFYNNQTQMHSTGKIIH